MRVNIFHTSKCYIWFSSSKTHFLVRRKSRPTGWTKQGKTKWKRFVKCIRDDGMRFLVSKVDQRCENSSIETNGMSQISLPRLVVNEFYRPAISSCWRGGFVGITALRSFTLSSYSQHIVVRKITLSRVISSSCSHGRYLLGIIIQQ